MAVSWVFWFGFVGVLFSLFEQLWDIFVVVVLGVGGWESSDLEKFITLM